jgi:hypothetical protein
MNSIRKIGLVLILAGMIPGMAGAGDGAASNLTGGPPPSEDRVTPLERSVDPGLYDAAMSAARRWQKAVSEGNVDALVEFALPEYKESVRSKLRDPSSVLHRYYFGESNSLYRLFGDAMAIKVALIAHRSPRATTARPEGITACYYDTKRVDPRSKDEILGLMTLQGISVAQCIYFFESDGRWYSNFEYNQSEDE